MTELLERRHGPHHEYSIYLDFLRRLSDGFFEKPYPRYPRERFRDPLFTPTDTIPDGPWTTGRYTDAPTDAERRQLERFQQDSKGRPLHPWLSEMVRHPKGGVVTGKGFYWRWGPNYTADAIVLSNEPSPHLLLIQRRDTGHWALPGGFVDSTDPDTESAARREVLEEAGCILAASSGRLVYQGVVADTRTTAHAWAETSAYVFLSSRQENVQGSDDASNAAWVPLNQLPEILFGSHAVLVKSALKLQGGTQ